MRSRGAGSSHSMDPSVSEQNKNFSENTKEGVTNSWSDDRWEASLAAGGGAKRTFQYCNNDSGTILYSRVQWTFRTQLFWSFITGQCDNSERILPIYLPNWMCVQFAFYHQFWINIWRSKFEQQTDSILTAYWSSRQKSQGSWKDWLECTMSWTVPAWSMEETSRRGILACNSERINILSGSVECYRPSRNTSSPLQPKSCQIENWRSFKRKVDMSPLSPPKISARYEWTKELNWVWKLFDNQKVKLFDKPSLSNQPSHF